MCRSIKSKLSNNVLIVGIEPTSVRLQHTCSTLLSHLCFNNNNHIMLRQYVFILVKLQQIL